MRKYNLDELPQIWQILLGQMTWVGPRPIAEYARKHIEEALDPQEYQRWYDEDYKPHKKGLVSFDALFRKRLNIDERRTRFDKFYSENQSLGFDLYLMWRAVLDILKLTNISK